MCFFLLCPLHQRLGKVQQQRRFASPWFSQDEQFTLGHLIDLQDRGAWRKRLGILLRQMHQPVRGILDGIGHPSKTQFDPDYLLERVLQQFTVGVAQTLKHPPPVLLAQSSGACVLSGRHVRGEWLACLLPDSIDTPTWRFLSTLEHPCWKL